MRLPPRWVIAVSLAVAGTLPGDSLLYAVLPIVWADLGLELWMVGVLLSANRFVRLATNPLAGWLVGLVGMRRPFIAAVLVSALTTAAYGLGSGFALLLAARLVWGVCWSFLRLGGYLAALGAADPERRGFALGFYAGVASGGTLLAVLFGGLLTDLLGFRSTVLAFASLAALAGLAMLRERPEAEVGDAVASPAEAPAAPLAVDELRTANGRAHRWTLYTITFVNGAAGSGLAVATLGLWLSQLYGDAVGVGSVVVGVASLNGLLLSVRFGAGLVWAPAAGHLADRYGRIGTLAATGALCVACLLGLSLATDLVWTAISAIGLFLGGTALRVGLDAMAGDLAAPHERARVMSWYANASDLGAAVGPFAAYPIAAGVGLAPVYQGGAVCLALSGLGLLVLRRASRRRGGAGRR